MENCGREKGLEDNNNCGTSTSMCSSAKAAFGIMSIELISGMTPMGKPLWRLDTSIG